MAEFKEVCKQWRRMCKAANECDGNCVELCALAANPVCGELPNATDKDLENAEAVIMEWAKENPEPVYPTWVEWLVDSGVFPQKMSTIPSVAFNTIRDSLSVKIPADIAEKLDIAPKVVGQ